MSQAQMRLTPSPALDIDLLPDFETRWLQATEASLVLGEFSLVQELCAAKLELYPAHLDAYYYEARLALVRRDLGQAQPKLEQVLAVDPEHWPARWALGALLLLRGETLAGLARCYEAARCGGQHVMSMLEEALPAALYRRWRGQRWRPREEQALWDDAQQNLLHFGPSEEEPFTLDSDFQTLYTARLLEALWEGGAKESARRHSRQALQEHPCLVKARLLLAESAIVHGNIPEGMSLLHDAQVTDPGGRVAQRLALPMVASALAASPLEMHLRLLHDLPAAVLHAMERGAVWQAPVALQLAAPGAKRKGAATIPSPTIKEIQEELSKIQERMQRHLPAVTRTDLASAEVIVAARTPLSRLYGAAVTEAILEELRQLAVAIEYSDRTRSHLIVLDDEATLAPWKLGRVEPSNPAAVKGLLDKLDEKMVDTGEQLSYLLLVGGHEIIPHHRLPNPVDDHDIDVPSDNPYGSHGDNYLIPSRAVGRLPHEHASPDLLLAQIRRLTEAWRGRATQSKGGIGDWFAHLLEGSPVPRHLYRTGESWGFAAQVWERAAEAVFRTLDSRSKLALCPPMAMQQWESEGIPEVPFYYFNLHGVEENALWYGQVDPKKPTGTEPYPVALSPAQLQRLSLNRAVVFSEACYGANPHVRDAADSMALTAIKQGCSLYVGSTKTSYASFAPPLMAADLLAALFWKAIAEGVPGGIALQQAKVQLAEATMRRTGYLDVEEQKTLMSFILYGDPALPLPHRPRHANPEALRVLATKAQKSSVYQVSDKGLPTSALDPAALEAVREYAKPYVKNARTTLRMRSHPVAVTNAPPSLTLNSKGATATRPSSERRDRWHVTLSASQQAEGITHHQVLTMTVDKKGKVLRSHVSR